MDEEYEQFMEEISRLVDLWTSSTIEAVTSSNEHANAIVAEPRALEILRNTLSTADAEAALQHVVFSGMWCLVHSLMSVLDGSTELADSFTIDMVTSTGKILAPGIGLNELFVEHLYSTERLPYGRHST